MTRPASFFDFLRAYGDAHPPALVYREGDDFEEWRRRFRAALEGLLGPAPERVEPRAETLDAARGEGFTRLLLRIPVSEFIDLPAYLLIPGGLKPGERRPGLLASHGHHHRGADALCAAGEHDPRMADAARAARAGYVVLAPAWWGWARRDGHLELVGRRDKCNVIQMAAAMYGVNVLTLHLQDARAAVDVLSARPEADPQRLGALGNSYGGRLTMWFAAFDERLRACVAAGCMNTFRERSLKLSSCGIQYLPGLLRFGDVPEVLSLIAPRALQLQAGEQDGLITPRDRDHIASVVRAAYRRAGAEDRFEFVLHPRGHELVWPHAERFFRARL